MGIPNPTTTADDCHKTSLGCSERLVELVVTRELLLTVDYRDSVWRVIKDGKDIWEEIEEEKLEIDREYGRATR